MQEYLLEECFPLKINVFMVKKMAMLIENNKFLRKKSKVQPKNKI